MATIPTKKKCFAFCRVPPIFQSHKYVCIQYGHDLVIHFCLKEFCRNYIAVRYCRGFTITMSSFFALFFYIHLWSGKQIWFSSGLLCIWITQKCEMCLLGHYWWGLNEVFSPWLQIMSKQLACFMALNCSYEPHKYM